MTTASTVAKRCVACGKDVAGAKRMKDSQGRYWCVDCGMADQRKKIKAASKTKSVSQSGDGLMEKVRGLTAGGGGHKGRLVTMLIVMAVMAAIAGWQVLSRQ